MEKTCGLKESIRQGLVALAEDEITSQVIGDLVMKHMKKLRPSG